MILNEQVYRFQDNVIETPHNHRKSPKLWLLLCAFMAIYYQAHSQYQLIGPTASEFWFDQMVGIENSGIINGPQYKIEMFSAASHPFLIQGEVKGSIVYDGGIYYVPLLYDIYKDEVVVKHLGVSGNAWFVQLDKKRVKEFTMNNRLFRNFDRGFHEVLFESGDMLVVADRSKIGQVRNRLFNYVPTDQFFVVTPGSWRPIRGAAAFTKMLPAKQDKRIVKQFLEQEDIKVRRLKDADLVRIAAFVYPLWQKMQ